jgi:uncharacterized protein YbjT (DUF2867 family)
MVLVVGATGLLGSAICQKLARRGEKVSALVRESSPQEKLADLEAQGVELRFGDLKDSHSVSAACRGVDAIVSTASSTLSRRAGDSIESVDRDGQLNLVSAAKKFGVERFVFVSFRRSPDLPFPLASAKEAVEKAIASLNFTIVQAGYFMEVWLSPALGFDYAQRTARIYGAGKAPSSWVAFRDVAEMCAVALRHPAAERTTIEFGGPEALSPLDVVAGFEKIGGGAFQIEHVPEEALRAQFDSATDSMQKTFAGLMLGYARGDSIDMNPVTTKYDIALTSVDDYARSVLANAATA